MKEAGHRAQPRSCCSRRELDPRLLPDSLDGGPALLACALRGNLDTLRVLLLVEEVGDQPVVVAEGAGHTPFDRRRPVVVLDGGPSTTTGEDTLDGVLAAEGVTDEVTTPVPDGSTNEHASQPVLLRGGQGTNTNPNTDPCDFHRRTACVAGARSDLAGISPGVAGLCDLPVVAGALHPTSVG